MCTKYGIEPDVHILPRGVTTVLSQGDAGAGNWPAYQEHTIKASQTRVLLAINLAAPGESRDSGCFEDLDGVDVEACVRAIEASGKGIWGISVNTGIPCCGDNDPDEILSRGLEVAERTGKPLLFGSRRHVDSPLVLQLEKLRKGDVLTYCFSGAVEGLVHQGWVRDEVWEARERGVLFDIGHGMTSFDYCSGRGSHRSGLLPGHHLDRSVPPPCGLCAAARSTTHPLEVDGRWHARGRGLEAGDRTACTGAGAGRGSGEPGAGRLR